MADTGNRQTVPRGTGSGDRRSDGAGGGGKSDGAGGGQSESAGDPQPVFLSDSGELMTLPGGIVVVLDPEWDADETAAFFRWRSCPRGSSMWTP